MHIADQRGFSPAPRFRQVRQPHRGSRDTRPAGVKNSIESRHHCNAEQQFHNPMEVQIQSGQSRHSAQIDLEGTAIIGPTGSGKTTLVDALMTLITATPRYNLASTGGHESDRDLV